VTTVVPCPTFKCTATWILGGLRTRVGATGTRGWAQSQAGFWPS